MNEERPPSVRAATRDLVALAAVPVVLAGLHFLVPQSVQNSLALDHADPALHTFFTAAYFHDSVAHLEGNVVGYVLAATYTFALTLFVDRLSWFRRVFVVNLLVLPVVVNVADLFTWSFLNPGVEPVSRGFSGVAAAFVGSLLVALYVFLSERHGSDVGGAVGVSLFLVLMGLIGVRYGGFDPILLGLIAVGLAVSGGPTIYRQSQRDIEFGRDEGLSTAAVGLVGVVLAYMVLALFPPTAALVSGEAAVNLYAHIIGFLSGVSASLLTAILQTHK